MPSRIDPGLIPFAPDFNLEIDLWNHGLQMVAGVDEAGRGALAGPVAAAVLIFPPDPSLARQLEGVNDSKLLKPDAREKWAHKLREIALAWGVGFATNQEIDLNGIVPATRLSIYRALEQLMNGPEHILIDYLELPESQIPYTPLVKGDRRSLSIAAASILAKTARDQLLRELDAQYPGYGFAAHKGYGTCAHLAAIMALGPSPVHRFTFRLSNTGEPISRLPGKTYEHG
jgi:ribonuclease HII